MKKIGLLSDTHGYLPPQVFEHFKAVDEIWHAGDIGTEQLADELEKFKPLRAVYGNIDGVKIRERYPEHNVFSLEGATVYMTHIGGYPPRYNSLALPLLIEKKPNIFVCGHSHILKVMPDKERNLLHINPGACGKYGWHKVCTLIRFSLHEARVTELEVIEMKK